MVSIIQYFAGYASAWKWSEHKTEYFEGPFQVYRDVFTKFIQLLSPDDQQESYGGLHHRPWKSCNIPRQHIFYLIWSGLLGVLSLTQKVVKQNVQIRKKVTKYQNIVTFQCTHSLISKIERIHREIIVQSGKKSNCFLSSKMAALTPWRHGSSRHETAWFKSCSVVNSGFRQKCRKVMVRSQKSFRITFSNRDL